MAQRDYRDVIRTIRAGLPDEAFRPWRGDLWHLAGRFILCLLGYLLMMRSTELWIWTLSALLLGHSIFCIGNLAHMLTHRTILRSKVLRYPLEVVSWAMAFIPATIWRITHNQNHHRHTNARKDAFFSRRFTDKERTPSRTLYVALFYPNRHLVGNPLPLTAMLPFIAISTYVALMSRAEEPAEGSIRYEVSPLEKLAIVGEVLLMLGLQLFLFWLANDGLRYLFMGPVPVVLAACFSMAYIHTQYMGRPVTETHDSLNNSQSLLVPRAIDWLHQNVSHHVEHHLFPGVSSHYYPQIRELLREHCPESYEPKRYLQVWGELWRRDLYVREPVGTDAIREARDSSEDLSTDP